MIANNQNNNLLGGVEELEYLMEISSLTGSIVDSVGSTYLTNSITIVEDEGYDAMYFDDSFYSYFFWGYTDTIPYINNPNLPFTACYWVNVQTYEYTGFARIFCCNGNVSGQRAWEFGYDKNYGGWGVRLYSGTTANYIYSSLGGGNYKTTGNWMFLCATYDGSAANTGLKVYMNATLPTQIKATGGTYTNINGSNKRMYIGTYGFIGLLSQVKLIRGALTQTQIATIYNAEKGYFGL